jgi:hypothetical protein
MKQQLCGLMLNALLANSVMLAQGAELRIRIRRSVRLERGCGSGTQ